LSIPFPLEVSHPWEDSVETRSLVAVVAACASDSIVEGYELDDDMVRSANKVAGLAGVCHKVRRGESAVSSQRSQPHYCGVILPSSHSRCLWEQGVRLLAWLWMLCAF